jgi:hypothetical protein
MELKNFVTIYDNALPIKLIGNLIRYANKTQFEKATILDQNNPENFNIRRTYSSILTNRGLSMTNCHWHNILYSFFKNGLDKYKDENNIVDFGYTNIIDIEILKYEETGFYTWHTDHCAQIPRTMSCILLLNNDYEGGNLCFRNPDGSGEWQVDVKPNRMIIWPSNFLYPHTVKPVTKGTRYSVVAWAL